MHTRRCDIISNYCNDNLWCTDIS